MSKQQVNEASARYIVHKKKPAQSNAAESLITQHLDLWSSAIASKNTTGRGSNKKIELYGVKKLRELILELAVRGKLVPQDPNDEPASELLKRTAEEKEKLIKAGLIRRSKKESLSIDDEHPFRLPKAWEWVRLAEISSIVGGFAFKSSQYSSKGVRVIRISDFDEIGIKNGSEVYYEYAPELEAYRINKNDILMAMTGGTVGKSFLVSETGQEMFVNQRVAKISVLPNIACKFVSLVFGTGTIKSVVESAKNSTNDNISMGDIQNFLIPVPSVEEQYRIVAKVDELMALCDQLENQTEQSLDAHATLADTLLDALTQAQSHADLMENWQRLEQNWDILFPSNIAGQRAIDKLKKTILQLAVMGKLVPQDPNDEPASQLLKRITAEKEQLVKDKKIKKQKPLPPITDEERPFELPEGWEWARLGSLGLGATGKTPSSKDSECFGGNVPFIGPGQITPEGELLDGDKYLTQKGVEYSALASPGDLLMVCIGGSIGKSVITDRRVTFNQQINSLSPVLVINKFLFFSVCTTNFKDQLTERSTGSATPIINRGKWEELCVPLPPLEEQKRIVAQVEELTTLCDQLKQRLQTAQQTQQQFTDAVVAGALR